MLLKPLLAAAVLLAISVRIAASTLAGPAPGAPPASVRVLINGGGTSHDFVQAYSQIDAETLRSAGDAVTYTESFKGFPAALQGIDVLIQASNQLPDPDNEVREALHKFLEAGHGLIIVHAGAWYNWKTWPDYNTSYVAGGTHDHDHLGKFVVDVVEAHNPLMQGVSTHFEVTDELYHQEMRSGAAVEVLATATSPISKKTYPIVWLVKDSSARIVCITLGHDERTHQSADYERLLRNAVAWAAKP